MTEDHRTAELSAVRKDAAQLRQQLFNASKRNDALSRTLKTAREELLSLIHI